MIITVLLLMTLNVLLGLMGIVGFAYILMQDRRKALWAGMVALWPILWLNFYLVGHPLMIF